MSSRGELLVHPVNGYPVQTWDGFNWPAFLFTGIWLLVKRLWGQAAIWWLLIAPLAIVTYGLSLPVGALVYGFIGNGLYKRSLLMAGFMSSQAYEGRSPVQQQA